MKINQQRLDESIHKLATFTEDNAPYTRRSFTPLFLEARAWLKEEFIKAGLEVSIDAGGNLIGRRLGSEQGLKPIYSGSHSDTVPRGGRFDGMAGVMAALEVVHALNDNNVQLKHDFYIIDFLAEEPSDYGVSCIGSRALSGDLSADMLAYTAPDGSSLAEGIKRVGGEPSKLCSPLLKQGDIAGFFELHIEQGPVLETENISVGIVTDIVGIARYAMKFTGKAAHSGTVPMDIRKDALVGAAEVISEISKKANQWLDKEQYVVATVGKLDVTPNGSNVVPGMVDFMLEVRSNDDQVIQQFPKEIAHFANQVAENFGLTFTSSFISFSPASLCHLSIQNSIEVACKESQTSYRFMSSGAGHDAAYMTKLGPSGMVFIPCLGGRSHCPEEWSDATQIGLGTNVMYQAIIDFDKNNCTKL